ncbi:TIGR03084 family metal-binding protein [Bounagaea algeriensis]
MTDVEALLDDLRAEGEDLDSLVAELPRERWALPTPAAGWTIAHQIAHLTWTDSVALTSATDPAAFAAVVEQARQNPLGFVDEAAEQRAHTRPAELLVEWRSGRERLREALHRAPADRKLDWFGPPMGVASMATARLMETWAHGQDVADALGAVRTPTGRLRHVAHIGVRTRDFAYALHGQDAPDEPFRVELTGPDDQQWTWGPADAGQRVTGRALDFCLLVTQRRHRDDLAVTATGPDAAHWLTIAQAFAGAPGTGRKARQFP